MAISGSTGLRVCAGGACPLGVAGVIPLALHARHKDFELSHKLRACHVCGFLRCITYFYNATVIFTSSIINNNNNNNNNNNSIQFFIIYVPSQQLQGQL
jgi:hypothetical protein